MRINDLRPTRYTDDRRGGTGFAVGGLGLIGAVVIALLLGVDPSQILNDAGQAPQTAEPGQPRADDAAYDFARRIVGSAEDVWTPILKAKGVAFQPATLTVYDNATPTSCGTGVSAAGPFYCPDDSHIYLDLSFFNALGERFGAPGRFAQAYVVAHEFGHHVQELTGTMQAHPLGTRGETSDSVRIELQADCYAGVWANRANAQFKILESGDVDDGLRAAAAVGDDTLEKQTQGTVVPDSFTHGTSAERVRWFKRGLDSGDMDRCDTFGTERL
ncbi:MAG TPA: neutral zinc metallopeptidase [Rhizomicrobium sp.]|nr:neutral zinc metallopeptidase [Rhizomicrobium sp.]